MKSLNRIFLIVSKYMILKIKFINIMIFKLVNL